MDRERNNPTSTPDNSPVNSGTGEKPPIPQSGSGESKT
jgi:hypothetical protein